MPLRNQFTRFSTRFLQTETKHLQTTNRHNQASAKMGTKRTLSEFCYKLIIVKQTTDTPADTQQPTMERKVGQMEEASWEVHSKEVRTVLEAARYAICVSYIIRN